LAALLVGAPRFRRALDRAFASRLPLAAIPFLLVVSPWLTGRFGGAYQILFGFGLESIAIVLVLLWAVERPNTAFGRLLNARVVAHVGVISYSLYLWQQMFTHESLWWAVPATVLAAEASYYLVERPSLFLRERVPWPARSSAALLVVSKSA
jgi:peptidoglycan/LPS O-acetylase OafA/YrhL